jgi:hypothetical protein
LSNTRLGETRMDERFRKTLRGTVISSRGFRVRILGPTGLSYSDTAGTLHLDSEAMAGPGMTVVLYAQSVPEDGKESKQSIIDNIARAFAFAGWTLEVQE